MSLILHILQPEDLSILIFAHQKYLGPSDHRATRPTSRKSGQLFGDVWGRMARVVWGLGGAGAALRTKCRDGEGFQQDGLGFPAPQNSTWR